MPENGDKILEAVYEMRDEFREKINDVQIKVTETNSEVKVIKTKLETVENRTFKHEKTLYGNPEQMGEGGLVSDHYKISNDIKEIRGELKGIRGFFSIFWTGTVTVGNLIISWLLRRT